MTEDISHVVALAWGVAEPPTRRGPKRELTHEQVIDAAIAIADEEGLPAVTMQRVAQQFGFTTMALYRYVASKADLQQLMFDRALDTLSIDADTDTSDWRTGVREWALHVLEAYRRHPWTLDIPLSAESLLMPAQIVAADAFLRATRSLAADIGVRIDLMASISLLVRGIATSARELAAGRQISPGTYAVTREAATVERFPDIGPLVRAGHYVPEQSIGGDLTTDDLLLGLDLLLVGIEHRYGPPIEPTPPT